MWSPRGRRGRPKLRSVDSGRAIGAVWGSIKGRTGNDPISAIENLIVDCAHNIDDDNLEAWPDYFAEDAVYQIIPRRSFDQICRSGFSIAKARHDDRPHRSVADGNTSTHTLPFVEPAQHQETGEGYRHARISVWSARRRTAGWRFTLSAISRRNRIRERKALFQDRRVVPFTVSISCSWCALVRSSGAFKTVSLIICPAGRPIERSRDARRTPAATVCHALLAKVEGDDVSCPDRRNLRMPGAYEK